MKIFSTTLEKIKINFAQKFALGPQEQRKTSKSELNIIIFFKSTNLSKQLKKSMFLQHFCDKNLQTLERRNICYA